MAGGLLRRRTQIAIKQEAVPGTQETLTNSDAGYYVYDANIEPDINFNVREILAADLSPKGDVPGAQAANCTFRVELAGSGVEGTAPPIGIFLQACNMAENIVPSTSVAYSPASNPSATYTIWVLRDGVVKKMYGAIGTWTMTANMGEIAMFDFDFRGVWGGFVDLTLFTPVTYNATVPKAVLNTDVNIDASPSPACIQAVTMDYGNELALRECMSKSTGYFNALVTGRRPVGTINPEMVKVSDYDFFGKFLAGTYIDLDWVVGSGAGNRFEFSVPKAQIIGIPEGDRNGIATTDISFVCTKDTAGDDELIITQTQ
jgi:hypothetical protein